MQRFIGQIRAARLGDSSAFFSVLETRSTSFSGWDNTVMFNFCEVNAQFFETEYEWWNVQLFNFELLELLPQTNKMITDLDILVTPFVFETSPDFL